MSPASLIGFQSWLEAGPPGTDWTRPPRLDAESARFPGDGRRLRRLGVRQAVGSPFS